MNNQIARTRLTYKQNSDGNEEVCHFDNERNILYLVFFLFPLEWKM